MNVCPLTTLYVIRTFLSALGVLLYLQQTWQTSHVLLGLP